VFATDCVSSVLGLCEKNILANSVPSSDLKRGSASQIGNVSIRWLDWNTKPSLCPLRRILSSSYRDESKNDEVKSNESGNVESNSEKTRSFDTSINDKGKNNESKNDVIEVSSNATDSVNELFTSNSINSDVPAKWQWTEAADRDVLKQVRVIVGADVVFDDDCSESLALLLFSLLVGERTNFESNELCVNDQSRLSVTTETVCYIAVEKRVVFTLQVLHVIMLFNFFYFTFSTAHFCRI
jgi:hypothetical protein